MSYIAIYLAVGFVGTLAMMIPAFLSHWTRVRDGKRSHLAPFHKWFPVYVVRSIFWFWFLPLYVAELWDQWQYKRRKEEPSA